MAYESNNTINNDNSGRATTKWSSKRNNNERLRHRPHISNTSNSRGTGYTKYYSSLDADILFGGVFIDEVTNLNFAVQQNALPIFGYNSYTFDDIALGSRLVQGTFSINFTEANYLTRVQQVMTTISRQTYGEDKPATSNFTDTDRKIRNTPIWDKGFDIVIGYGEKNKKSASEYDQVMTLNCCQLTGCSQQLDYNGEPLMETYSFIARDITYVSKQQYVNETTSGTTTTIESSSSNKKSSAEIQLTNSSSKLIISPVADIEYTSGSVFMKCSTDPFVFSTDIEMKIIENKLVAEFNKTQTTALIRYTDETESSLMIVQARYHFKQNGQDKYEDVMLQAKITRS